MLEKVYLGKYTRYTFGLSIKKQLYSIYRLAPSLFSKNDWVNDVDEFETM